MYTTAETLSTTKQVELVGTKEFSAVDFNPKDKIFLFHKASLTIFHEVYLFRRAQIALLKLDKTSTTVLPEYSNFVDIFSLKLIAELLEYTEINNHAIDLINDK